LALAITALCAQQSLVDLWPLPARVDGVVNCSSWAEVDNDFKLTLSDVSHGIADAEAIISDAFERVKTRINYG
jgi:hypothetical protein